MHEYRRFVQAELDARGWKQSDLARRSGLSRQLISNIMRDRRPHIGQMPDADTIAGLAKGFGISEEIVRTAAARALAGYTDDGTPLQVDLTEVPTDALLHEIRRRIFTAGQPDGDAEDDLPGDGPESAGGVTAPEPPKTVESEFRKVFNL